MQGETTMWVKVSDDRIVQVFEMHVRKSEDGYFVEGKTVSGRWIGITEKADKEQTMIFWRALINAMTPKKGFKIEK